jgi:serine/threonine protein kinase
MFGPDLPGLVCVRRINDVRGHDNGHHDEVHLALRVVDGSEVAVRVYGRAVHSDRDRQRFEEETAALTLLGEDPHVVAIHDAGVGRDGRPYLVTDYCANGSLYDHLTAVGRLTPAEVRGIGAKLAGALAAVHRREIVHRNVKPANVLIDGQGEPVLTDFGLVALALSHGDYTPETNAGRAYVAPEAFLPELMSAAADIYSLGATLYALLAGWAPRSASPLAAAVDGESLLELPRVPWTLMSVLRRAMALDPRDRFDDADEMAAALTAA